MIFLISTKAGLLKNIEKHLSKCLRCREMSKTKVGTFFFEHPVCIYACLYVCMYVCMYVSVLGVHGLPYQSLHSCQADTPKLRDLQSKRVKNNGPIMDPWGILRNFDRHPSII